ncbi:DUF3788 domain-containing protein [Alkaliphilus transvaalensis]|uniref:DUF3788 domain-containing protein n=1 Tax=Alkaliphilus transvaalensis TaxID=114628 RepID=UPI00047B6E34|nr:DUF3788 domain-containing protein [Alkaliphilus transvaalensis]
MKWNEIFNAEHIPSDEDIREYLGDIRSIWDELTAYIEKAYQVEPQVAYRECAAQPGWNVKYKKSNKSLCTLYPMAGYFIALVVVGPKEEEEVKIGMDSGLFNTYIKELYDKTAYSALGRWLMIEVKDKAVLNDIKHLMSIRVGSKK